MGYNSPSKKNSPCYVGRKGKGKTSVRRKNEARGRKIRERLQQARESLIGRSPAELKLEKEWWDIY